MSNASRLSLPLLAAAALAALLPAGVRAQNVVTDQDAKILSQELKYVDALNRAGFPDYADLVLRDIQAKYPAAKAKLKVKMLEQVLQLGNFEEAQGIIEQFAEHAFRVVIMQVERCARDFRLAAERRNRDFFIRRMREEFQQCVLDHLLRHQRSAVGFSLHCLLRFYTDFRNLSRNVSFP